jgi:hypothetical protein
MRLARSLEHHNRGDMVKTTEHVAKPISTPKARRFATLRGLLRCQGNGAPSRTLFALPTLALIALPATLACLGALVAPALAAGGCPNEQLREEQGSTRLPECRAYEMASPVFKAGYAANAIVAVAPNGESVAFDSVGAFAGDTSDSQFTLYLSHRTASGWSTASLLPPASIASDVVEEGPPYFDFSSTLESFLIGNTLGSSLGNTNDHAQHEVLLHSTGAPDTPAGFEVAGQILESPIKEPTKIAYRGASANLSHILLVSFGEPDGALLPAAVGADAQLYDLVSNDEGTPSLQLVALNNDGEVIDPYCEPALGAAAGAERESGFNAIADGGVEIFFTANANRASGNRCDGKSAAEIFPANPALLFVRINSEKTLQLSVPLAADCVAPAPCASAPPARAVFEGANEAGTKVFFTTSQPLVTGDTDSAPDLYMANIGCPGGGEGPCAPAAREVTSLAQVSHDPNPGQAAEVQGVVRVSPDGSRVYFVARGVLNDAPNAQGDAAVQGADNLYVYDSAVGGAPVFVADLCSGPELSGVATDVRCPGNLEVVQTHATNEDRNDASLWLNESSEAQTAGADGRFLLFSSYGRLVAGDTDIAKDVYRYDAETGALVRVSLGEDGYDTNGNDSAFNAEISVFNTFGGARAAAAKTADLDNRAITEDGSRVVFTTAEPLSPDAVNGLENVYEWHEQPDGEGVVSLISTGSADEPISSKEGDLDITPEGRDIFFQTTQGLVSQDTDGQGDVYDARIDGGFPSPPAPEEPCSGDACQGPLTNPAPLLVPGSVSQAPGGNFAPPAPTATVKPKPKSKVVKCRKGYVKARGKCVKNPKAKKAGDKRSITS